MGMTEIDRKLDSLRSITRDLGSVLVAYSGGVDSAVVLAVAHQELQDRALACIATSPSYPRRELDAAIELARQLGAHCRTIQTREHLDAAYSANGVDRCYFCKSELYRELHEIAAAENWRTIANGTNTSDIGDHRFGMAAAAQNGIRSPLLEAGISKAEVREIARQIGLPVWDKPSTPCLSSRVPRGTAITPQILQKIESAEDVLAR